MGALSRRVQLVLLCEDSQHEAFARRFLREMGWDTRAIRVEKAPGGRGAGEQFVRERYPVELKAHRSRPVSQALVALIDGDAEGVTARLRELDQSCRDSEVAVRAGDEAVAIFVPTWNVETWLAYLDGAAVAEDRPSYPRLDRERECQRHVDVLARMCREGRLRQPAPSSLEAACGEYNTRLASIPR
jgi:hypothetical protein